MSMVTVYTALYGSYDGLVDPVEQDVDVEWVCFTDDPSLRSDVWRVIVDPPKFEHPRLSAKWHKMLPHLALPGAGLTVWVDANVVVDSPAFARESVAWIGPPGFAVWRHPQRRCIYDEAEECAGLPKCEGQPIAEQMAAYRAAGHPPKWGLYGCRSIARDSSSRLARELGARWLDECERWSYRDQLSFPYVVRRLGVRPSLFPHHLCRHTGLDAVACRIRRVGPLRTLARRAGVSTDDVAGGVGRRRSVAAPERVLSLRSNPWFDIVPHRRNA